MIAEDPEAIADEHAAGVRLGTVAREGQDIEDLHIVIQNLVQKRHKGIRNLLKDTLIQEDGLGQWKNRRLGQRLDLVIGVLVLQDPVQSLPVKDTPILLHKKKWPETLAHVQGLDRGAIEGVKTVAGLVLMKTSVCLFFSPLPSQLPG